MKTTKPCYAIIIPCDGRNGQGRPIIMEGYLDLDLEEVSMRAESLKDRYGDALVVELPIRLSTEVIRVAGSVDKVHAVAKRITF